MKDVFLYSALGFLGFGVLNAAWIWLFVTVESRRRKEVPAEKQPAPVLLRSTLQFEPSGD